MLVLASACSLAAAQDVLLTGHVRRVVLHPSGGPECPPVCPAPAARNPDGSNRVGISNDGGCQIMDVDIDTRNQSEVLVVVRQLCLQA
ncbi:hypothetical protein H3H36_21530 [Duganella sp. FT3S]|uniref:Uncharacterized protein n=1 Tax=Rugamonas fusca TaxID=2758568 RepID=A0A7W2EL75_9BURK|nr:hypothetical protein [Rugamonas fusca]MBA5607943.1 hypothetical protein [Rugamonas fusca]